MVCSGKANPLPLPSLHYYLKLTVSADGAQKRGQIHIHPLSLYVYRVFVFVLEMRGPALLHMNGSNKAGLGLPTLTADAAVRI